ncbi:MAG: hypothetical protein Kow0069_01130 [Promethearchaeota archaeon]
MPIVTSEDQKELAAHEQELASMLKTLVSQEQKIFSAFDKLAEMILRNMAARERYVRKQQEVLKDMDKLARAGKFDLTVDEVGARKGEVSEMLELIEQGRAFANALKDFSSQSHAFVAKKLEFGAALFELAKQRLRIVGIGVKLEKAKNAMQVAEKLQKLEDALKDEERTYERVKREFDKKAEQRRGETEELNGVWAQVRAALKEFWW